MEEFRSRFSKQIPDKEISTLIPLLTADQSCRLDGKYIAASSFKIQLTEAQKKQLKQLQKMVDDAGFNPVKIDDGILPGTDISELARLKQGEDFIFLTPEYIIAKKRYEEAIDIIYDYLNEHGKMTLGDFRDATHSSRKASMLILEFIDARHITAREENYRIFGPAADKGRIASPNRP